MFSKHLFLQSIFTLSIFILETVNVLNLYERSSRDYMIIYAVFTGITFINFAINKTVQLVHPFCVFFLGVVGYAIFYKNFQQIRNNTIHFHVLMASLLYYSTVYTLSRIVTVKKLKVNKETEGILDEYVEYGSPIIMA